MWSSIDLSAERYVKLWFYSFHHLCCGRLPGHPPGMATERSWRCGNSALVTLLSWTAFPALGCLFGDMLFGIFPRSQLMMPLLSFTLQTVANGSVLGLLVPYLLCLQILMCKLPSTAEGGPSSIQHKSIVVPDLELVQAETQVKNPRKLRVVPNCLPWHLNLVNLVE